MPSSRGDYIETVDSSATRSRAMDQHQASHRRIEGSTVKEKEKERSLSLELGGDPPDMTEHGINGGKSPNIEATCSL